MNRKMIVVTLVLLFTANLFAGNDEAIKVADKFKNYFNTTLHQVKNEPDANGKRKILNSSLERVDRILNEVSRMPGVPENDVKSLSQLRKNYREYYNELNGLEGYVKVDNSKLNDFANYLMQSNEQADKYVVISITTLLLIIIILILLL